MLEDSKAFNGLAVKDIDEAKRFYGETLRLKVTVLDEENGLLELHLNTDQPTLAYVKPDLEPSNNTILNFPVDDIDRAVDGLAERGVEFEKYDGMDQDERGIMRGIAAGRGPDIAWFKDPSGNIFSVLKES
jgi:catechol 2,3-dioxygenase-like lactoylglutathione lyase family enzyme